MRFLHTADWHVGKTLKGRDRLDEQRAVLAEIAGLAEASEVDAVLVAGDVYDLSAPSAAAQQVVVQALLRMRRSGAEVIVIAGNHDHGPTFEAYRPLMGVAGITLAGTVRSAERGGVIRFTARSDGAGAQVAVLPFLSQRYAVRAAEIVANTPSENVRAYDEQVRQVIGALTSGFGGDTVNLVMSHITCVGGTFGGGERSAQSIFEYSVPASVFPVAAHYVALGHLHRRQALPAPAPVHYSGAPLAVDFGEQDNASVVCLVEAAPGTPARVTDVPVTSGRRLRTVHGTLAELEARAAGFGDDYLRVYLQEATRAGLRDDTVEILPNALEVRIDPEFAPQPDKAPRPAGPGGTRAPAQLFADYCGSKDVSDPRVAALFGELHDEVTAAGGGAELPAAGLTRKGTAMRPITLDMQGFASFRDEARVDFADAEFFALVGPTGSGKSTVIDAMTFALYGSVPRWGRKGMVSLALSPTVARGTVKLVFEVDRQRYVVARELRRVGGAVSQRAASLERLADPRGLARPGDQTFPLAKDLDGVNEAVEQLLGLRYEDFVQCVVLPQGQFAAFLHAKPSERQDILLRLLGAEHYRLMMVKANQRASVAAQRAGTYGEELLGYADATAEAEQGARAAEAALARLGDQVKAALPQVSERQEELKAAGERLRRLRAEAAALSALRVPDGTGQLDADLAAGRSGLAALRAAEREAEAADAAARDALAAGPQRAPLELARAHRAEHARHQAALPGLAAEVSGHGTRSAGAAAAVDAAAAALDEARVLRDEASQAAEAAAGRVAALTAEHERLAAVSVPAGTAELDERRTDAGRAVAAAADALEESEQADAAARDALAAAPPEAPLAQVYRDLSDLRGVLGDVALAGRAARRDAAARDAADAALSAAEEARRARHAELEEARRAHVVAGLRPHLVTGAPCPVCEQVVATLPAPVPAREVEAAQARLAEAERAVSAAQSAARKADAAAVKAAAGLEAGARRRAALAGSVSDALSGPLAGLPLPATRTVGVTYAAAVGPDDGAGTDGAVAAPDRDGPLAGALAEVSVLGRARREAGQLAERAAAAAREARARHRSAQARAARVEAELTAASTALRAARDPLVELGAPAAGEAGLAAGWAALARWAGEQARARSAALDEARAAAAAAGGQRKRRADAYSDAERALARLRAAAKAASEDDQQARARLSQVTARVTELGALLAGAPGDEQITEQLALRGRLEAAAAAAETALRATRAGRSAGEAALAALERAEREAAGQLSAARDHVVALGAPALDGRGLLDGWTTLMTWASGQVKLREQETEAAARAADAARAGIAGLTGRLSADLARAGIGLAPEAVTASAATAVTGALEGARAAVRRVEERRAQAADLAAKQRAAAEQQQVAHLLGNLLQARQFPQWLVSEALDDLVSAASRTLAALSAGQFDLTHDKGDLFVIDHTDADSSRSVRTLSGGETFQASLALALALSSQISALAAAGAARLDSIFLDEGFGTLDAETLEVVATTLEALAQGDRMVGIVTHVPELAERVPVRFRVSRNARTSVITREGVPAAETGEP